MQQLFSSNSTVVTWVIIPLLICLARIIDVSLGTLRIILAAKGIKFLAPAVGFIEILIWLLAIGQVMQNLDNVANFIAYAVGFSLGSYLGIILEEKLAIGKIAIRIVTPQDVAPLIAFLRDSGHSVTMIDGEGAFGPVNMLFTVIRRSELASIAANIKQFHPRAFYTVEDIRYVSGGVFTARSRGL